MPPVMPRTNPPSSSRHTPTTILNTTFDSRVGSTAPLLPNMRSPLLNSNDGQNTRFYMQHHGGVHGQNIPFHQAARLISHASNPNLNFTSQPKRNRHNHRSSFFSKISEHSFLVVCFIATFICAWALYGVAMNVWTAYEYDSDNENDRIQSGQSKSNVRSRLGLTVQHEACIAAVLHSLFVASTIVMIYGHYSNRTNLFLDVYHFLFNRSGFWSWNHFLLCGNSLG
ncbi:hypothetical protein M3Y94_00607200 [Aphelenchoides besseyi]|nr:hypothetical protein M3Y94_00607200 [Aphelenchoides besseyi]